MFDAISTNDYNILIETFVSQQYLWLAQRLKPNTLVIDIGAHCGDSAIYLAQQPNVKRVLAYDNYPPVYERAKHMLAKAKPDVQSKIAYQLAEITNTKACKEQKGFSVWIPKLPLKEILAHHKGKPIIIKCDCEGAEHTIFDDEYEDLLKNVYRIQIEYHGGVRDLEKNITRYGFKTIATMQLKDKKLGEVGWVYAER